MKPEEILQNPKRVVDALQINGASRVDLAVSASPAQTAALTGGLYDVWATVDCYLKIAVTANDVTVAAGANAGYLLRANNTIQIAVPSGMAIGAVAGGSGTLSYHQVN